jgi:hypothetical protein
MHPVYYCDSCDQPIIGTVFTRGEIELCHDCYRKDLTGDPYNPPKNESVVPVEAYNSFTPADMVNKPPHYNQAGIECIDAMKAMVEQAEVDPHASYCWQNSFKYLWRWPYKNGVEDLKKARWYLDRLISEIEARP